MPLTTATEKQRFMRTWEREHETTLRVLRALPAERADFSPAAPMKSAKDLGWVVVAAERMIGRLTEPEYESEGLPPLPPASLQEVISAYERHHAEALARMRDLDDLELERSIPFPVAPGQVGELRKIDVCWGMLMDQVHHRGQLTVYLRLLGAKVPSIYGPTADEPWM